MMSSSRIARAAQVIPLGVDAGGAQWSPDELPRYRPRPQAVDSDVIDARVNAAVEEAYARGFEEGRQAGATSERARVSDAVRALESAADALELDAARWLGNAEENICALAVLVARHVLDDELSMDRTKVLDRVRMALAEFPVTESVRVRVNPADLQAISSLTTEEQQVGRSGAIRWSADSTIVCGGCLVEGHERIVDGRIDSALERLYRRLSHAGT